MKLARAHRVALYSGALGLAIIFAVYALLPNDSVLVRDTGDSSPQWSAQFGAGEIFPACNISSPYPCLVSPANPVMGETVTWTFNPSDVYVNIPYGNTVDAFYMGENPVYLANPNYGYWQSYQSSATQVYSSPGTYYTALVTNNGYEENCAVTVSMPPAACTFTPSNPTVGDTVTLSTAPSHFAYYDAVWHSYIGTDPVHNPDYGSWPQGQSSKTMTFPSEGTQYAELILNEPSGLYTVTERCSVNIGPPQPCTSSPNACGQTGSGFVVNGSCNASTPANPAGYGASCTSSANHCGMTNTGTIQCNGSCSASEPSNSACNGRACTAANACGNTNGTYQGNGVCAPPANPSGYGDTCASAPNACGQTQSNGTIQCNGSCSSTVPSNATCPPSTPTLSALWKNGSYVGTTGAAYDTSGYQVYAQATSPAGANLAYYFEWSSEGSPSEWTGWVGSGGWGGLTHYVNFGIGTFYARAWAYDAYGNWSASPSSWLPITLTTTAPAVSCSGSPGNPYTGQAVTWSSSVSGGSGSYSYSWSGDESLSGTSSSVSKTYTSIGQKSATLSVTDTRSGQTGSATCSTGANQPDGPTNGGSCSNGVCPGSCTGSLSVNPSTIQQGQNTTLSWSVTGASACATSCSGSGFNTGGTTSGSVAASSLPVPPSTAYALTCSGGTYGPPPAVNTSVTVLVPTVTFTVNGQTGSVRVNPDTANNTTVVWSSANAVSCAVTKNGAAWSAGLSSAGTSDTVTSQTVYAIDCINNYDAHATASVSVNVLASFTEF